MSSNSDSSDTPTNSRERALVNLRLMRSIGVFKDHITTVQEGIRTISGTLATSKELYDKADRDLQQLADVTEELQEELNKMKVSMDTREAANTHDNTVTHGGIASTNDNSTANES